MFLDMSVMQLEKLQRYISRVNSPLEHILSKEKQKIILEKIGNGHKL